MINLHCEKCQFYNEGTCIQEAERDGFVCMAKACLILDTIKNPEDYPDHNGRFIGSLRVNDLLPQEFWKENREEAKKWRGEKIREIALKKDKASQEEKYFVREIIRQFKGDVY